MSDKIKISSSYNLFVQLLTSMRYNLISSLNPCILVLYLILEVIITRVLSFNRHI